MKSFKYASILGLLVAPISAISMEIDQSQTVSNASLAANYFAPIGQSFTPTHNTLSQVTLKLTDTSTATNGSHAHIVIHESTISGPVIGTSESTFLEDCFNFEEGPGCGVAGGYGKEISFSFSNEITINPGSEYVIELIVDGDATGVNYAYNDEYANGAMYKQGQLQSNDLWFKTFGLVAEEQSILVSDGDNILNYGMDGNLISSVAIPPNASNETSRDLFRLADGRIAVFNGTFQPVLSVLDGETWSHHSFAGWSIPNNLSYGGITADQNYIYVTDGNTSGASERGIVRFDLNNGFSAERFLTNSDYIDVTLGLDNQLYALRNSYGDLDIIDPQTMQITSSLDLGHTSSSRAVIADADSNIYMASWNGNVYQYSNTGVQQNSVSLGSSVLDLDINSDGELLVSDRSGNVFRLNSQLATVGSFSANNGNVFVAFSGQASGGSGEEPKPEYCLSNGSNTNYEWIDSIGINGQNAQTGNNQGYNFDEASVKELRTNEANNLVLVPGFRYGSYTEKWNVWIDLNRDHRFDDSEKIYTGTSKGTLSSSIELSGAQPGETRMRVSMAYGNYPDACGTFTYGEVEDFRVNIIE